MPNTIHIDLRNLTPEMLAEAKPRMGYNTYNAPCVIGVLVPKEERRKLDGREFSSVLRLSQEGLLSFPTNQLPHAVALQEAFDQSRWADVEKLAAKFMGQAS